MRKKVHSEESLVQILKTVRKKQRVSQEQLADFTGLSRKGIGKIELGQSRLKFSTFLTIAKLLGINVWVEHD